MKVGDMISVSYVTGEQFDGEVIQIREMTNNRVLFTLKIEGVGFRAMYLDKCVSCDKIAGVNTN